MANERIDNVTSAVPKTNYNNLLPTKCFWSKYVSLYRDNKEMLLENCELTS